LRSAFRVRRSPFGVRRSAFGGASRPSDAKRRTKRKGPALAGPFYCITF
jgi:hypothetical protein